MSEDLIPTLPVGVVAHKTNYSATTAGSWT